MIRDIEEIFEQLYRPVFKYTMSLCHDADLSENIVADVFASYCLRIEPVENVKAWLFRSAWHCVIHANEHSQHNAPIDAAFNLADDNHLRPVEMVVERRETKDSTLCNALSVIQEKMTPTERRVVIVRFIEGNDIEETAEYLGLSKDSVRTHQKNGMRKIRDELGIEIMNKSKEGLCCYPHCKKPRTHLSYCHQHYNDTVRIAQRNLREKKARK